MQELIAKLEFHVAPIVKNLDLELWGIEILPGVKTLVRIYLEKAGIEECSQVSRLLGLVLDVEEIFSDAWVLEVSTPGLDRTFFNLEQMFDYKNETVLVNLFQPIIEEADKKKVRRKITGKLLSFGENSFEVLTNDGSEKTFSIELDNVKKVKLVPNFDESDKSITATEALEESDDVKTEIKDKKRKNSKNVKESMPKQSKNDQAKMQRLLSRVVEEENTLSYDEEEIAKIFAD